MFVVGGMFVGSFLLQGTDWDFAKFSRLVQDYGVFPLITAFFVTADLKIIILSGNLTLQCHVLFWPIGEQVDNADTDGSYVLTAVVSGGTPKADTFQWELQDGRIINPGYEDSEYATGASSVSTL